MAFIIRKQQNLKTNLKRVEVGKWLFQSSRKPYDVGELPRNHVTTFEGSNGNFIFG